MAEVFISYPHEAADKASMFARSLQNKGIDTWYAPRNLTPGLDWKQTIQSELSDAIAVVFLVMPHHGFSNWMEQEYMAALESYWEGKKKLLVPVLIGGSAAPPGVLGQWKSLSVNKDSDWDQVAGRVVRWLRNLNELPEPSEHSKQEWQRRLQHIDHTARAWQQSNTKQEQSQTSDIDRPAPQRKGVSLAKRKSAPKKK